MKKLIYLLLFVGLLSCRTISNNFWERSSGINLNEAVQNALIQSGQFEGTTIQVSTAQKTVSLTGYVKTIRQSDLAETITRSVPGVQMVDNQLIVRK